MDVELTFKFFDVDVKFDVERDAEFDLLDWDAVFLSWNLEIANFTVRWANPFWDLAGSDPTTKVEAMLTKIQSAASAVRAQADFKFSANLSRARMYYQAHRRFWSPITRALWKLTLGIWNL